DYGTRRPALCRNRTFSSARPGICAHRCGNLAGAADGCFPRFLAVDISHAGSGPVSWRFCHAVVAEKSRQCTVGQGNALEIAVGAESPLPAAADKRGPGLEEIISDFIEADLSGPINQLPRCGSPTVSVTIRNCRAEGSHRNADCGDSKRALLSPPRSHILSNDQTHALIV